MDGRVPILNTRRTPAQIGALFLFIVVALFITQLAACGDSSEPSPRVPLIRPFALSYADSSVVYAVGQPIIPNKPSVRGTVDSFSIEPALPVGLTIDSHTGVISGTPASASAATIYEVKATNAKGSAVGRIQIEIIDHVIVPDSLRYSLESAIYAAGQEIVPNMPITTGGEITQFTVGPGLPLGLSLNPQTGVISGAPLFAQSATQYTVTGANSAGNVQTSISIAVQLAVVPPPVVVPPSPQTMNWQPCRPCTPVVTLIPLLSCRTAKCLWQVVQTSATRPCRQWRSSTPPADSGWLRPPWQTAAPLTPRRSCLTAACSS